MGTRGGARPGAGRPVGARTPHTKESEAVRKAIVKGVKKGVKPILTAMIDLALGVWVEQKMPHGKTRVYRCKPDVHAAKYLFDQVVGKPKEMAEITGKDGEAIKVNFQGMSAKDLDKELKNILKK